MTLPPLILTRLLPHFTSHLFFKCEFTYPWSPAQRVLCLLQLDLWSLDPYRREHLFPQLGAPQQSQCIGGAVASCWGWKEKTLQCNSFSTSRHYLDRPSTSAANESVRNAKTEFHNLEGRVMTACIFAVGSQNVKFSRRIWLSSRLAFAASCIVMMCTASACFRVQ